MSTLAYAQAEIAMWSIALGIGAVVIAVVIALLTLLLRFVEDIDTGVAQVWQMATKLAANTATAWQLQGTANTVGKLKEEIRRHDELWSTQ
ncbi:MAG TPA: hypothetical protein VM287_06570 [Egibacteraceae bacterium]|nr:hypothetical protein [Egibacteraceae bacterium]